MGPTETLKHEHQVILLVLEAMERETIGIRNGGGVNTERVNKMVGFAQNFADRCHHAKEENLLFPRMVERGVPLESGPIGAMLADHQEGRRLVHAAAAGLPEAGKGDRSAATVVAASLLDYVVLLRAHIAKEDNILYPLADQLFTAQDQADLTAAFDRVEAEEMGDGVHEQYHQLAHELAERV